MVRKKISAHFVSSQLPLPCGNIDGVGVILRDTEGRMLWGGMGPIENKALTVKRWVGSKSIFKLQIGRDRGLFIPFEVQDNFGLGEVVDTSPPPSPLAVKETNFNEVVEEGNNIAVDNEIVIYNPQAPLLQDPVMQPMLLSLIGLSVMLNDDEALPRNVYKHVSLGLRRCKLRGLGIKKMQIEGASEQAHPSNAKKIKDFGVSFNSRIVYMLSSILLGDIAVEIRILNGMEVVYMLSSILLGDIAVEIRILNGMEANMNEMET
ncbi:hypothetical protein AgCh_025435 [Apium graveolens]